MIFPNYDISSVYMNMPLVDAIAIFSALEG
jgi:hypothetical protein